MTHPDILAALARERSAAFLAEAEATRRARQARPRRRRAFLNVTAAWKAWLYSRQADLRDRWVPLPGRPRAATMARWARRTAATGAAGPAMPPT